METGRIILRPWRRAAYRLLDSKSLISGHFVNNPASGRVMKKCGSIPTGETVIDETQYHGASRPIRVLRLELR